MAAWTCCHTDDELKAMAADVDRDIADAVERALKAAKPAKDTAMLYVYSPDVDPTSADASRRSRRPGVTASTR